MTARVTYLYGFVPEGTASPSGLAGVGDAPVEVVDLEGMAAVLARLDAADYGPEAVEARGADMEWMAEQGLRHEEVVAWFVDHAYILPSRLLTLFSSEAALREQALDDADRIRRQLARFDGLREWDLKVTYDQDVLEEHLGELSDEIARMDAEIEAAGPGRRYLLEKKRADAVRAEARSTARRLARDLLGAVRDRADEVSTLSPPSDEVPVVLNAALLIRQENDDEVRDVVRREADQLGAVGLRVEFSGPWAPYRFLPDAS